jgi:hypothetical protein
MITRRQLLNSGAFVAFLVGLIVAAAASLDGALAWTSVRPQHPRRSAATATASRRTATPATIAPARACVTPAAAAISSASSSSPLSPRWFRPSLALNAAPSGGGFGKSSTSSGGKKKASSASSSPSSSISGAESSKLKPKQQWDRYIELKGSPKVKVGIRATNKNEAAEWLEVGHVKFQTDVGAPVAVARQRALIAEVRTEPATEPNAGGRDTA